MLRYRLLLLLVVIAVIAYIQRTAMSVPLARIADDLDVDLARDMGWVQSGWYFGYAVMQLPSAWVADRLGSRWALAIFSVVWSLLTLAAGLAPSYFSLLVVWTFMGAAQAGIFPCAAKAVGQTFPDLERARASGMLSLGMYIGTAFGPLLTAALLNQFPWPGTSDWRACLVMFALPGMLWSALFLQSISAQQLPAATPGLEPGPVDWRWVLRSRPHLLLFAQQFLRACGMVFFTTWFPIYLQKARDLPVANSGVFTFYAGLGGMAGSLLGGFASDAILKYTGNRWLSRQGIAVAGAGSCALLATCSYFIVDPNLAIVLVSLGTFCATFGGVSAYTMAIEIGGKQVTPIFSVMNMSGNIGAMLFPIGVGALVKASGDNWNLALFLFAGIMAGAAICWAKIDTTEVQKHAKL